MTKNDILVFLVLITLFIFLNGCYKNPTKADNQEELGRWEILTQSPIKDDPVPVSVNIAFFDENNGITEKVFQITKTTDGGRNWKLIHDFDRKAMQSLVFTDDNVGWVVGNEPGSNKRDKPFILNSKDRGDSWQEVVFDKEDSETINKQFTSFNDICFSSPEKGWIVGNGGILEISIDEQNVKVTNQVFNKEELNRVSCNDNGEVWAVGAKGFVYHFQNSWNKKQVDGAYHFSEVKLFGNDVWLLGYKRFPESGDISGILLRSRDDGMSWEEKTPDDIREFNDLYIDNGEGWLVGSGGNIYYSNDNGDSWKKFKSPTYNNLEDIYFLDAKNIWIGGTNQTILKFIPN